MVALLVCVISSSIEPVLLFVLCVWDTYQHQWADEIKKPMRVKAQTNFSTIKCLKIQFSHENPFLWQFWLL